MSDIPLHGFFSNVPISDDEKEKLKDMLETFVASEISESARLKDELKSVKDKFTKRIEDWNNDPRPIDERGPTPLSEMKITALAHISALISLHTAQLDAALSHGKTLAATTWAADAAKLSLIFDNLKAIKG